MTIEELKSNLRLPLIAAPMFLVSGTDLVVEACKNGIIGTFPSLNGRTAEDFENMLKEITSALEKHENETDKKPAPFGVNLIVNKSNSRIYTDLALCKKYKVPLIITSLGAAKEVVEEVHSYGGLVFHDVIKKRHAEKAAEAGVDGIITVGAGAGGHGGTANPFALIKEIKAFYNGAIIMSGALSSGEDILAAEVLGADFAYMGTRFIASKESLAVDGYKSMLADSSIDDIVYTDAISGVHANFLRQTLEKTDLTGHEKAIVKDEDGEHKAWKDIWSAGHGVANIQHTDSVENLVSQIEKEYQTAIQMVKNK